MGQDRIRDFSRKKKGPGNARPWQIGKSG